MQLEKNWIQLTERLMGKTQFESQKFKGEKFTWNSSGCMDKESVSIMYYQRHTNRLINAKSESEVRYHSCTLQTEIQHAIINIESASKRKVDNKVSVY